MQNQRSSKAPLRLGTDDSKWVARTVSMIITNQKHALGLVHYLRTIGHNAWIEDTNGNAIDEKVLKLAIRSRHEDT
jgi:hypothetical protein